MAREEKAYARVIEKVKKMILSGELKPGEKLPPEREFAEKLEECSGVFDIFIEDMRYGILKNEN